MSSQNVHAYALRAVREALANYKGVEREAILPRHRLDHDLGLDPFDLALLTTVVEEDLQIELPRGGIDEDMTVLALANIAAALIEPEELAEEIRRRASGRPMRTRSGFTLRIRRPATAASG